MIASSGQPEVHEFDLIKQAGYDLVINLALTDSPHAISNEAEVVKQANMEYLHIPVDFKAPTVANLDQFFNAMEKNKNKKIYIHCALNMRVSAFLFLYRTIKQQWPVQKAIEDLNAIWKPDAIWENFINSSLTKNNIRI